MIKLSSYTDHFYRKHWLWLFVIKASAVIVMGLDKLLWPLFWLWSRKPIKKIPVIDHDVYMMSAMKLARMIRNKEITSEEIIRRYVHRINKVNPIINAVVQDRFVDAIREARAADVWLKQTLLSIDEIETQHPLLGVPVTVKESCKVKGMSFSVGINTRRGMVAEDDGEVVKRVRAAGGIPLLVSNTPEICFGIECDNLITGRCNNPYNTNYTCGGSSGGEGALLGSACSVVGVGSDLACSIRIPALFNGIFGHKPTASLVPNRDHCPFLDDESFAKFLVIGPMARFAEDLRLLLKVMTNNTIDLNEKVNWKNVNVHYTEDIVSPLFIKSVSKDTKLAIRKCVDHLKDLRKCTIYDTKLIDLDKCFDMSLALFFDVKNKPDLLRDQNNPSIRYSVFLELLKLQFNKSTLNYNSLAFNAIVKSHSLLTIKDSVSYYHEMMAKLRTKLMDTLGPNGILLFPTMPSGTFQHKASLFNVSSLIYSMIFNILGFPATHVPLGLNRKGLPIGVQVVACPDRDAVCLSVAEELGGRFGGWVPPPS